MRGLILQLSKSSIYSTTPFVVFIKTKTHMIIISYNYGVVIEIIIAWRSPHTIKEKLTYVFK